MQRPAVPFLLYDNILTLTVWLNFLLRRETSQIVEKSFGIFPLSHRLTDAFTIRLRCRECRCRGPSCSAGRWLVHVPTPADWRQVLELNAHWSCSVSDNQTELTFCLLHPVWHPVLVPSVCFGSPWSRTAEYLSLSCTASSQDFGDTWVADVVKFVLGEKCWK